MPKLRFSVYVGDKREAKDLPPLLALKVWRACTQAHPGEHVRIKLQ